MTVLPAISNHSLIPDDRVCMSDLVTRMYPLGCEVFLRKSYEREVGKDSNDRKSLGNKS